LLCSDGLSGQVEDVEIATLLDCLPEQLAVEVLVDLANLRGGPDNTTVVVASVTEGPLLDTKMAPPEPAPSDQMAYWGTAGALAATALCLIGAVAFWQLDRPVSMLITLGGALIAGVISASSLSKLKKHSPSRGSSRNGAGAVPPRTQQSPYRRYAATPDQKLFDRLGKTIEELREAAKARNWLMEWEQIEQLQHEGAQAMQKGEGKHAILAQSKAIVETMHQLREQHNRSAGETAIDQ
jgi:protein phosphatase